MVSLAASSRLRALLAIAVGGAAGLAPVYKLSLYGESLEPNEEAGAERHNEAPASDDSGEEDSERSAVGATCDAWDRVDRHPLIRFVPMVRAGRPVPTRSAISRTPRLDVRLLLLRSMAAASGIAAEPYCPHAPPTHA